MNRSNFVVLYCLAALVLLACGSSCLAAGSDEADAGFVDLFNGKDLDGWVVEGASTYKSGDEQKPIWTVKDGAIHCIGKGYGFLRYDQPFGDFELRLKYRMKPSCNSGVGIRHAKFVGTRASRPSFSGYEIQLLDDGDKSADKYSTASLYRYVAPKASAAKPAGEWNEIHITCKGPRIKIVLNDEVVQDVDQSKIKAIADKPLEGYLSIQNHGGEIEFRDIQAKQLEAD